MANNEKYNQIIDEAWKKYLNETRFTSNPEWLEPVPVMDMKTGEKAWGVRQYRRNDFINKCKTDTEFSERWGLKIEERELSLEERATIWNNTHNPVGNIYTHNQYDENNIPAKLITITYNNETIEGYE